jgi:O-antigen ligase
VNVALERYTDEGALREALEMVSSTGLGTVRQRFSWAELESVPGEYRWELWDRVLPLVRDHGLQVIAVLDSPPAWARPEWEADNPWAPPTSAEDYARFVGAFAARYRGLVLAYQIWDEPNVAPHWGKGPIEPAGYVELLHLASAAIRGADEHALIVVGGLAPNVEPGGRNMSDVAFLREIYRRGAGAYFDVLGVKAYGFWTGPDDRRTDPQVLNFSRVVLLREEMVRRGDAGKPLWALEGGWCALPADWAGMPSPQGSDTPFIQGQRLDHAILRMEQEWPWMGLACLGELQPNAPPDSPIWGYALLGPDGELQLAWEQLRARLNDVSALDLGPTLNAQDLLRGLQVRFWGSMLVGLWVLLWCGWAGWGAVRTLPWRRAWGWGQRHWLAAPGWLQVGAIALFGVAAACAPSPWVRLASLGLYGLSALLRPDLGLLVAVFCIPLGPVHVRFGPGSFSLTEASLLVAVAARAWQSLMGTGVSAAERPRKLTLRALSVLDWAVFLLVLLGLGTSLIAEYRRVAFRELRVVVCESALLYGLVRTGRRERQGLLRLMDVLWLSGVCVALYGLARYPSAGGVIEAEGVRRARAFYGSPNNLALYLERILPLGLAVAAWGKGRLRRWAYGLGALGVGLALLLTFSRGAWFLGIPAMLASLAWMRGGRARWIILGALVLGLALLVPLAGTERLRSLLSPSGGTTFLRFSLWQAAWDMVRDHPWLGVGLDNFLYYYDDYIRPGAEVDRWLSHPHNVALDFWLRLGIGGVLLVATMLGGFVRWALRAYRRLPEGDLRAMTMGLAAGMAACVAHGMIDSFFFVVELAFWFMFALAWVSSLPRCEGQEL